MRKNVMFLNVEKHHEETARAKGSVCCGLNGHSLCAHDVYLVRFRCFQQPDRLITLPSRIYPNVLIGQPLGACKREVDLLVSSLL